MPRSARKISELTRQLNLLPYFQRHPGRSVMEAARDLGQSPQEIMEDLNRLWMCGLPGLLPGDLVELEHSYTSVKVFNAQGMDKPLRLTPTEAGVLLLTLESLENLPGLTNQQAVISAARKLRDIMGESATAVFDSTAEVGSPEGNETLATIREAMDKRVQLRFTYHSHSSDNTKQRQVSPAHIFTNEGETYVTAWEDVAQGHRTFRVDRIEEILLVDEPGDPHSMRLKFSANDPFNVARRSEVAHFQLREDATWLADYMTMSFEAETEKAKDDDGMMWFPATAPLLSREWFIRFAISHADQLKVTGPKDLCESIGLKVRRGLSAYNHDVK